jgi:signal transduction histidine kinase
MEDRRDRFAKAARQQFFYPEARFVTDFARLLMDVNRMKHEFDNNGKQDDSRKAYGDLRAPNHLRGVANIVASYCRKSLNSPAGIIFAERDGRLEIVSQWRAAEIAKKHLLNEMIEKGPVARAFRTGQLVLWRNQRALQSTAARSLRELLRRCGCRNAAFLPIRAPAQRPLGVLALVLPDCESGRVQSDLARLEQIVSACIVHAYAYDEALAAREKAEDAVQKKDEFLSILSHELRNPMMPILGWAVALSSGTLPEDKQNIALQGIVRNIRTLNYLIEDLFDAARIASGKLRLELSEVRLQDVTREALTAIQQSLENKKLRIATDISEAIPPLMADSRRLHQVLMNLLNNAVKFTPTGGSIALQVRKRGDSVECVVCDTGKGIEREFLPFVFDRFRQGNRPAKVHIAGLGLGLAIVREIVELHGGSIQASSDGTDKGATFVVRLPLRRKQCRSFSPLRTGTERRPARNSKMPRHSE